MADRPLSEDPQPSTPDNEPTQRVADADRDRTVTLLREHVVEGRLTLDEFSQRMGAALEARTRGELDAVMADLPSPSPAATVTAAADTPRKKRRWHVAVMSGHSTKGRWRIGGKTNAVAIMGGCDMDLRRAEIEGPVVEITAFAFWGGIDIIVPEGFDVELRGFSFMGGRSLRLKDVPIVPDSPRIVVRGFAIMSGIDVKSRPNRSARQIGTRASTSDRIVAALDAAADRVPEGPVDLRALGRQIRSELNAAQRQRRHRGDHRDRQRDRSDQSLGAPWANAPWATAPGSPPPPPTPTPAPTPSDATVTIVFCDMVDYAGMTERLGDRASRRILLEEHRVVREALLRHNGREIKVQGDGFMIAFGGVARAMRCAVDIQQALKGHVTSEGERITVHIGIHTGDAVAEDDDYLGHTVIVASRLADAAAPGEILVSSLSEQLVQRSGEFVFKGHRETQLKGMARPQPAATLAWADWPTSDPD